MGDAREVLARLPEASVHLAITSPPYWMSKRYEDVPGQMGHIEDYEAFLDELDRVWRGVFRPLVPGERPVRMFGFVGDVVLDPFACTRTTLLAALKWGREAIGVELVPRYAKLASLSFKRPWGGSPRRQGE